MVEQEMPDKKDYTLPTTASKTESVTFSGAMQIKVTLFLYLVFFQYRRDILIIPDLLINAQNGYSAESIASKIVRECFDFSGFFCVLSASDCFEYFYINLSTFLNTFVEE